MSDEPQVPHDAPRIKEGRERNAPFSVVDYSHSKEAKFYANHVGANITLFDIRLGFSTVEIREEASQLVAEETLTVFVSPELAGVLHAILGEAIKQYTAKYGQLRTTVAPKEPSPEKQG